MNTMECITVMVVCYLVCVTTMKVIWRVLNFRRKE